MTAIEARNLGKRFGARVAVDDLSFTVESGTVTGFLGLNGAGKTTTLRLMVGLDHGDGETLFHGFPYDRLPRPVQQVGVMLDGRGFHPKVPARRQLQVTARASRLPLRRVDDVLDLVGLAGASARPPAEFSLGMRQRLALAAALLGDPDVLVLDEPGNGLDPQGLLWLRSFLREYADGGRAVLLSSHSLAEVEVLVDDVVVIDAGRLVAQSPLRRFVDDFTVPTVRVRSDASADLAAALSAAGATVQAHDGDLLVVVGLTTRSIAAAAARGGHLVHELHVPATSLEDAFLAACDRGTPPSPEDPWAAPPVELAS